MKCDSCDYFEQHTPMSHLGVCVFCFPPWMPDDEGDHVVRIDDSCSLWALRKDEVRDAE